MKNKTTIEYNKQTSKITLNTYDDGFFISETDITDVVLTLALESSMMITA